MQIYASPVVSENNFKCIWSQEGVVDPHYFEYMAWSCTTQYSHGVVMSQIYLEHVVREVNLILFEDVSVLGTLRGTFDVETIICFRFYFMFKKY